ncbi:hypothetical protein [Candidatus Poriferisodalis sp.]
MNPYRYWHRYRPENEVVVPQWLDTILATIIVVGTAAWLLIVLLGPA